MIPQRARFNGTGADNVLRIGGIELDMPFVQAALSGYSDLPMRRLARLRLAGER